jgi:hypothetical protein
MAANALQLHTPAFDDRHHDARPRFPGFIVPQLQIYRASARLTIGGPMIRQACWHRAMSGQVDLEAFRSFPAN